MSLIGKVKDVYSSAKDGNLLTNLVNGKAQSETGSTKYKDHSDEDIRRWYKGTTDLNQADFIPYNTFDDPTIFGFKLFISPSDPLFYIPPSSQDQNNTTRDTASTNSAYNYLLSINQNRRAEMLKRFIDRFNILLNQRSYFLQKLSGLSDIYKIPDRQSFIERQISFTTLESIDTFMSAMAHDYNNAIYDYDNMKYVVPINLRYFSIMLVITEIRQFKTFVGNFKDKLSFDYLDNDNMVWLNKYLGVHAISFSDCQFDFTESNDYLANLDNTGSSTPASNKFKITLGKMRFNLTDLNVFSKSSEKKIIMDSYLFPTHNTSELYGSDSLRRFSKEPEGVISKKTLGKKIKDAIVNEAKKTANKLAENLDDQISNIVNMAESNIRDAAGNIIQKYNPSSFIAREITNVTSKFEADINNFLNDTIDNFSDTVTRKGKQSISEKIINEVNDMSKSSKSAASQVKANSSVVSSRTTIKSREEIQSYMQSYNESLSGEENAKKIVGEKQDMSDKKTESEKLRKKVCDIILYGRSPKEFIEDTIESSKDQFVS